MDVIGNQNNLVIDNAIAAEGNREIFIGSTVTLDTATSGDSVYVNDTLTGGATLSLAGWISYGPANGVNIVKWGGSIVNLSGNNILNFSGDGVRVSDETTIVKISTSLAIRNNGGYGLNATVPTNNIYPGAQPYSNTSGAYSPDARIQNLNNLNGYQKYPDGRIHQWVTRTVTGAANTFLGSPAIALPIPWPTTFLDGTINASQAGFSNGAIQGTVSSTPSAPSPSI